MQMTLFCTNYLDDFIFCAQTLKNCNKLVRKFLDLCGQLGVPVALDKTEWATQRIVFLGILLDGVNFRMVIPEDKRVHAVNLIKMMLSKKKATIKEMEHLAGLLNFLNRAIYPGRAFTRRMYAKFAVQSVKLRKYHHVNLDQEFKSDCKVWEQFLDNHQDVTIARLFIDVFQPKETAVKLQMYSDASVNENLGLGCIFNKSWLFMQWEPDFIKTHNPSIQFLELYALCIGVFTWANRLRNRRFILFTDNISSRDMINGTTSGCKFCMTLIRKLTLKSLECNFRVFAEHVEGKKNSLSDSLSRMNTTKFKELAKTQNITFDEYPTQINDELWPLSKYWENFCVHLN